MKEKYLTGTFKGNEKGFGFVKVEDREDEIALGKEAKVLDGDEDVFARKKFDENIPLTLWCAFDYDKIKGKKKNAI